MKKFDQKIDLLRVISMLLVIVIHVSNYYCRAYSSISVLSFDVAVVFNALARIAVPIFFMISGALLLPRPYDDKKNNKRILRMIVVLFVFTIIYNLWDKYYMNKTIPSIIKLLFKPERKMLWFLYVIIGLYIAFPFIKHMMDGLDEKLEKKFVLYWFIFNGCIYAIKFFTSFELKYYIPIINGTYYLGYFILGYLIVKHKDKIDYSKYNVLNLFMILLNVSIITYLTIHYSMLKSDYVDKYLAYRTVFMNCISIGIFIFLYTNLKDREYKIINFISPYSFGVYLVHGMVLNYTMRHIAYKTLFSLYMIPLLSLLIFGVSFVIVFILKKIPLVKEYI